LGGRPFPSQKTGWGGFPQDVENVSLDVTIVGNLSLHHPSKVSHKITHFYPEDSLSFLSLVSDLSVYSNLIGAVGAPMPTGSMHSLKWEKKGMRLQLGEGA
jgi:hypothetical protein